MADILHRIKAYLYDNPLTQNPNDYMARVSSERTLNVRDICNSAVSRGGADTTAATMEHNVNLFLKEMGYQICDGYAVNTGYFTAGTQINGVFNSPRDVFDPSRHSVSFQFNQGSVLIKEIPFIEVEILGLADVNLYVGQVIDIKTGTVNEMLTPGKNLRIVGDKLKLAGTKPDVGIYFINQETKATTKVEATDVVVNNPSELIIVIPQLAAGTYKLEVRTQYAVGSMLKQPRSTVFERILTVV
jgi:hypothetical protein